MKMRIALVLSAIFLSSISFSQTICESGLAGIYPCNNVDLLSTFSNSNFGFGVEANDIWGWTDALDGKEYVLLGLTTGTAFFNIEDPVNPEYLGFLPTETFNSLWRDIKVYSDHAFIVSEASGHGMQVFDLTKLRNVASPPETFTADALYTGFGDAHNIVINEASGRAYGVGTNTASGGLHIVDISTPLSPTILGTFPEDGYTHDAQVVNYIGADPDYAGAEIAFCCNEDAVTIVNVTDPTDPILISTTGYLGSQYTHQGWLTPDHNYFISNDEVDELNNGVNTTTYIWDVQDLDAPVLINQFVNTTAAIDHNLYTDGNLTIQANYRAGLRILDNIDVANGNLTEVAYFDCYPSSDATGFNGAWSNYPYFESGVVAVSHIEEGLFLLRPQFIHTNAAAASYCASEAAEIVIDVETGFEGPVNLTVSSGLPAGATATFSANNVSAGTYTLTIDDLPAAAATYTIEVTGTGAHFTYSNTASFDVVPVGCTDTTACNYDPEAGCDDGSCLYNDACGICGGSGTLAGCTDSTACNYDATADCDDGSCEYTSCVCVADFNNDLIRNTPDLLFILSDFGCTTGSCVADLNSDGLTNSADILQFLTLFGQPCP